MAEDDRRMHEGRSRSLDDREPRDRGNEEPRSEGDFIGSGERPSEDGPVNDIRDRDSTSDREQESALGGDVATRSGTAETPEDEKLG
ncbi:hypothetical protein MZO42_05315 [Sphingomonas psychrotolerans]|uniref:Uncharacterized protein n=1 Tax=Sphingomonas psychrotolerans TaxID=1327635 RepID=A0ABU3N0P7_9SPHN|nr:hypothetical protein [Sphingomonas psychrotolerans]MDT8758110.1 hypothetical protein [Sphingomonas psychrotolerans]